MSHSSSFVDTYGKAPENPVVHGVDASNYVHPLMSGTEGAMVTRVRCSELTLPDSVPNTNRELPLSCTGGYVNYPVFPYMFNGSTWDRARGSAADGLTVKVSNPGDIGGGSTEPFRRIYFSCNGLLSSSSLRIIGAQNLTSYHPHANRVGATALTIESTNANDTAAGTGCRTVYVMGLDANWNIISESVSMNGTTPVTLSNSYTRIIDYMVESTGSGGKMAGTISILDGSSNYWGVIQAHFGTSSEGGRCLATFSVPAGYTAKIYTIALHAGAAGDFSIRFRENSNATSPPYGGNFVTCYMNDFSGALTLNFTSPLVFPQYSDIEFRAYLDSNGYDRLHTIIELHAN